MISREQWKEFVNVWQTSKSVAEIAERLQITKASAQTRSADLKKRGIPLRKFVRKSVIHDEVLIAELKQLAQGAV